jgi:hypothetical protein
LVIFDNNQPVSFYYNLMLFSVQMLPAAGYSDNPSTSFTAKFVHTSLNKNRCPINRVLVSYILLADN